MSDFRSQHIIEALRSGVPSRAVGEYFSEARPKIMNRINQAMNEVRETGRSSGMIFTGRYGEGKTHLLNTVFSMASSAGMVVSFVPLGKETPMDRLYLLYQKIMANTYLPGARQPGFRQELEALTPGSSISGELLAYAAKELETDKLYYLLKAVMGGQDEDEKNVLLADLEGDFAANPFVKKSFKNVTGTSAKFNQNFSKTKHTLDYFKFMSHLFKALGYKGWVILLDEAELIGRFGKKTRLKTYASMQNFLSPEPALESVFTIFSFSSSYVEDVIDKRAEFESAEQALTEDQEMLKKVKASLNAIVNAPELLPLTGDEIRQVLLSIEELHGKAYDWQPDVSEDTVYKATEAGGYLLRTKIRAAIEFFDQLYQYGEAGATKITELGQEILDEQETPDLGKVF